MDTGFGIDRELMFRYREPAPIKFELNDVNTRNEKKHRETCAKNRKKRKKRK